MQANEVRTLLHATPFESFSIHTANGRKFLIDHPEIVAFSVDKRTLSVAVREGGFAHLDLRLATHTEPESRPAKRRKK
jgi:hypothetical protein